MYKFIICICCVLLVAGCADGSDEVIEDTIDRIFTYELNSIEPDHVDKVTEWLNKARNESKQGQFHLYSFYDDQNEYSYEYAYGKGYTNYEVSLIHTKSQWENNGSIYIVGRDLKENGDSFVKIKYLKHYVELTTVSEIPIDDKLSKKAD